MCVFSFFFPAVFPPKTPGLRFASRDREILPELQGAKERIPIWRRLRGVTRPHPCTCLLLPVCVIITLWVRGWLNRASSPSSGSWSQHSRWHGYAQSDCNRLSSWKWKTAEAHSHYFLNTKQSTFFTPPPSVNCRRKSLHLSEIVLGFIFPPLWVFMLGSTHTQCTCLIKRPSFKMFNQWDDLTGQ